MILTDREIKNSLDSGLIEVSPRPKSTAFASSSLDLTLGDTIRVFKPRTKGLETAIDPTAEGYDVKVLIESETEPKTLGDDGFVLAGRTLILGWTAESIALHAHGRVAARVEGKSSLARIG